MRTGRRDLLIAAAAWIVLSALGLIWAASLDLHPLLASEEGEIVDEAFDLLLYLAVPVFVFVLVALVYSVVRFRDRGSAAPVHTHRGFVFGWVGLTTALAVFVVFNPGLKGLSELEEAATSHDLEVLVLAEQWRWSYTYADYDLTVSQADELVLPVDTTVRFRIRSSDVIHSFWIPAFRIKVDALTDRFTETVATPTVTGSFDADPSLRVQCAELCGTGHARMRTSVRVLEQAEFERWVEETREAQEA